MLNTNISTRGQYDPKAHGYQAVYHEGEVNRCPGCSRSHWYIGRMLAECAFCSTALPLNETHRQGQHATVTCRRWPVYPTLDEAA